jgi:hypothetical protein
VQALQVAEEIPGHFQLPGGEKAGGSYNIFPNACVYFVPEFGKKELVLRCPGDFVDITAIHIYHHYVL